MHQKYVSWAIILICMVLSVSISADRRMSKRRVIKPRRKRVFQPTFKYNCDGDFCNRTENYPTGYLRRFMKKNKVFNDYGNVLIQTYEDITTRQIAEEDGINMCDSNQHMMLPTSARTVDNEWVFIAQFENFTQRLLYDRCNENKGCSLGHSSLQSFFPDNYSTSCKQHRLLVQLLSIDEMGHVTMKDFYIPGGCACVYQRADGRKK